MCTKYLQVDARTIITRSRNDMCICILITNPENIAGKLNSEHTSRSAQATNKQLVKSYLSELTGQYQLDI